MTGPEQLNLYGSTPVEQVLAPTPGRVRAKDPSTAKQAAEKVSFRSGSQKAKLLVILARLGDAIPHQMHAEAGCAAPSHATTRLEELEALGLVERTAEHRPTPWNGKAEVWRPTVEGLRVAEQLRERDAA